MSVGGYKHNKKKGFGTTRLNTSEKRITANIRTITFRAKTIKYCYPITLMAYMYNSQ